jgi:hypothetical protein
MISAQIFARICFLLKGRPSGRSSVKKKSLPCIIIIILDDGGDKSGIR